MNVNDLKNAEQSKIMLKRLFAVAGIVSVLLLFLGFVAAMIMVIASIFMPQAGQPYTPSAWQETMSADQYAEQFPAEQMAPRKANDIDGNAIEAWYWCYEIVGEYNSPPVQQWITERGEQPIIWTGSTADVPALYDKGTFDLTGKQLHPFLTDNLESVEILIVGFNCPINASVGK